MQTKTCTKCGVEKSVDEFYKMGKYFGKYLKSWCKKCEKEHNKEYRKNNKEKIKEHNKEYYEKNKEYFKEYNKEYNKNNKEKIREYKKKYNKEYHKNNLVSLNNKQICINTVTPELKPVIQALIDLKNKKKFTKELKNA